jgi:hypothetical protein
MKLPSGSPANELTRKFVSRKSGDVLGWALLIEGNGWFGRVRDGLGDFSFGPSSQRCTEKAVEARIRHKPFEKTGEAQVARRLRRFSTRVVWAPFCRNGVSASIR